ncbi:hypothetical protein HMI54_000989 [Coelomomyces lativittatus]|nr:hypothetical protein HMI55_001470 [Coelomomyces lativittatus]KAJ1511173.1 hypothetical protein HMI54_000989 [Coelomomyces lativittatus]
MKRSKEKKRKEKKKEGEREDGFALLLKVSSYLFISMKLEKTSPYEPCLYLSPHPTQPNQNPIEFLTMGIIFFLFFFCFFFGFCDEFEKEKVLILKKKKNGFLFSIWCFNLAKLERQHTSKNFKKKEKKKKKGGIEG